MTEQLSAGDILTIGHGFMDAKVLLAAVKLHLFDELEKGPLTGSQIAERLGLHARAIPDFPDALVALGVLERDGDGPGARYSNTPAGADCLVRGRDGYVGGVLELYEARTFRFWTTWKKHCAPEHPRTRPNRAAAHCSTSSIGIRRVWSNSPTR